MHPILLDLGWLRVTSYGVALLLAFAVGIAVAARRARREGIDPVRIVDAGLVVLVTALLGSRLLWVATHRDDLGGASVLEALLPFGPGGGARLGVSGLSMQGGVVLSALAAIGFLRWRRVPLGRALDVMAPSVALGEGITRLGCFLNGCCFGLPCALPWGVRFPQGSVAGEVFGAVAVHPTQLYASAAGFAIFAALSRALPRRPFDGAIFGAWLALTGLQRLAVDLFRWYEASLTLLRVGSVPVTVNTAVALAAVGAGAAVLVRGYRSGSSGTSKRSR